MHSIAPKIMITIVTVALIQYRHDVLLATRPQGRFMAGKWEFPGGKKKTFETPLQALKRELQEEIGITLATADTHIVAFANQNNAYQEPQLILLYRCRHWFGTPKPLEKQKLKWITCSDINCATMPPTNSILVPTLQAVLASHVT